MVIRLEASCTPELTRSKSMELAVNFTALVLLIDSCCIVPHRCLKVVFASVDEDLAKANNTAELAVLNPSQVGVERPSTPMIKQQK